MDDELKSKEKESKDKLNSEDYSYIADIVMQVILALLDLLS